MGIGLIVLGLFVLYWRTQKYYHLIDDIVRRWGYLYIVPEVSPPPQFYSSKPSKWRHLFLIITHALNVWLVYMLWGWVPAILFAFSPISVPATAWLTGGYYAVTALLSLTAYFFIQLYPNFVGVIIASLFFTASLGSTITCLGLPFTFLIFNPWGLFLFWPTLMYLKGRRFSRGYQIRDMGKQDKFGIHKLPVMVKTVAYYIYKQIFPYRLAFFQHFGEDYVRDKECRDYMESLNKWFWISLASIIVFVVIGWQFSPIGVVWFLFLIGPFSQFKVLGQFVAERYMYLPSIGWYLILGNALAPYPILLWVVIGLYVLRSHFYIPAYEKIESLYEDGIRNHPECLANYANLGERYIHIGRLLDGRDVLQKGIDLDKDNFLCYTNMAAFWIQVKDIKKGLYYTDKSIDLGKTKSSWYIVNAMRNQRREVQAFEKKYNREVLFADQFKKKEEKPNELTGSSVVKAAEEALSAVAMG